jgi:hypothetical protein
MRGQLSRVPTRGIAPITPLLTGLIRRRSAHLPAWLCHGLAIPATTSLLGMSVAYTYCWRLPPSAVPANPLGSSLVAVALGRSAITTLASGPVPRMA